MATKYTDAQIRKLFPTYFDAAATATQVDEDVIRKILKMYSAKEGGRTYIGDKLKLDQSVIGRVLDKAFEKNILKKVPAKEFKTNIAQRMYDDISTRKIYKEIRPVRDQDFYQWTGRGKKPPVGSKFKIVFPYPDNPNNTVVPKKFQGVQFYKTEALADAAKAEEAAFDTKALRAKPYNQAVKDIHKIALKNADDINDVDELAQAIYGKANNAKDLLSKQKLIANDLVRYQEFLLGFKTIPGVSVPTGEILDEIISEFPPENQWGKFARGKIRDSQLKIRDQLLKTKGPKLRYLRDNVVKFIDSGAMELDEAMGLAATFEKAPGYTELGQVIKKKINALKNRRIDQPFGRLFERVIKGETGLDAEIKAFNKKSKAFQIKHGVDTAIIEYRPGESLDASKFIKHFDKLSPEAQKNVTELANKGIALRSKAMPMGLLESSIMAYKNAPDGAPIRKYLEKNIAHCADGCFIKVANANPERIAKKLSEDQKLIRLFRGESFPQRNIKGFKDKAKFFKTTIPEIKKDTLSGQWFTPTQEHASSYLSRPGQMKYVDVTPAELESFNRYKARVNKRPVKYSVKKLEGLPDPPTHGVTESFHHQLIPRYKLKEMEKAGRLKTKWDLNPFGSRYIGRKLVKPPKGILEYDNVLGGFVDSANPSEVVGQNQLKAWAADNPIPVQAGTSVKPGLLRKTGRALAHIGLPLPTAALDSYFIGRQIEEGRDAVDIAKDPFNWLGLATMDPLTRVTGMADKSGKLASVMRLGMSPGMIRGATRFLGLPGLALSTGLTAYDQYQKYKNKEGFIYDLFNREEIDNAQV